MIKLWIWGKLLACLSLSGHAGENCSWKSQMCACRRRVIRVLLLPTFSDVNFYIFKVAGGCLDDVDIPIQFVLDQCSSWPFLTSVLLTYWELLQSGYYIQSEHDWKTRYQVKIGPMSMAVYSNSQPCIPLLNKMLLSFSDCQVFHFVLHLLFRSLFLTFYKSFDQQVFENM